MAIYTLCEVPIGVACADAAQGEQLHRLWCELFAVQPAEAPAPALTFDFSRRSLPAAHPLPRVEVSRAQHLAVARTTSGYRLQCEVSFVALDVAHGCATGSLDDAFWQQPLEAQREFFLLSFLMLFQPLDLFGLHADGIVKDATGYLVAGAPGHGKTTLALSLVHAGWHFLADDALVLRRTQDGTGTIEALALRRGFSCTPQTAARFPAFAIRAHESPLLSDGKRLVAVEDSHPDRLAGRCVPQVLLFPTIAGEPHTRLVPIDETQALTALIRQSPGIMAERTAARRQLETLTCLTHQARCYDVHLGADVFEEPAAVAELLWAAR